MESQAMQNRSITASMLEKRNWPRDCELLGASGAEAGSREGRCALFAAEEIQASTLQHPSQTRPDIPFGRVSVSETDSSSAACRGTERLLTNTESTFVSSISQKVGGQIWQTTVGFLERLKAQTPGTTPEALRCLLETIGQSSPDFGDSAYRGFALLAHGLRVATTVDLEPQKERPSAMTEENPAFKRHLKAKGQHYYGKSSRNRHSSRRRHRGKNRLKAKTGRKPQAHECFLCHEICPYKVDLIEHFQEKHALHRSQSLLYKRISQGPESMMRLYNLA